MLLDDALLPRVADFDLARLMGRASDDIGTMLLTTHAGLGVSPPPSPPPPPRPHASLQPRAVK